MIDLNSDLGEGAGSDAALLPMLTSANVCCGAHAGDANTIRATLTLCAQHGVSVGAHPGFADRAHFGRREIPVSADDVRYLVHTQVRHLIELAHAINVTVRYLKPHGALYHQCHREPSLAEALLDVLGECQLAVVGLPCSLLAERAAGRVRFIAEGFADRRYRNDGTLVPRTEPNAMITDPAEAVEQVGYLMRTQGIETVCVHGDSAHALEFVQQIRDELTRRHITIRAVV